MKESLATKIRSWYAIQSDRDKRALFFLVLFMTGTAIYFATTHIHKFRDEAIAEYQSSANDLELLKVYTQNSDATTSATSKKEAIELVAHENNVTITSLDSGTGEEINFSANRVGFNELLSIIKELQEKHSIVTTKVTITRHPDSGYVSADIGFT